MKDRKRGYKNDNAKWGSVGSFEAIGQSWANALNSPFRKWKVQGMEGGICTPLIAHWPNGIKLSKDSILFEDKLIVLALTNLPNPDMLSIILLLKFISSLTTSTKFKKLIFEILLLDISNL